MVQHTSNNWSQPSFIHGEIDLHTLKDGDIDSNEKIFKSNEKIFKSNEKIFKSNKRYLSQIKEINTVFFNR